MRALMCDADEQRVLLYSVCENGIIVASGYQHWSDHGHLDFTEFSSLNSRVGQREMRV